MVVEGYNYRARVLKPRCRPDELQLDSECSKGCKGKYLEMGTTLNGPMSHLKSRQLRPCLREAFP